ncbi:MAG: hypothetical protein IT318_01965 [Anaerolineales bacterium]|nr:hypothetical protein [Anaerolineales bacterium]
MRRCWLGNSDYVAGVGGKMAPGGRSYELRFSNHTVAQAFAALNRLSSWPRPAKLLSPQ